jgi:hypothetical protein
LPGATGGARHEGAAQRWRRGAARCRALPTPGPTARKRGRDSSARSRCDRTRGGDVRRIPALDWEKIHRTMRRHARGWWSDLPEPRNPRNLLLVRPTGKRRGREPHPPQAENHLHSISSSEQIADTLLSDLELPLRTSGRFDSESGTDKLVKLPRRP